MSIAFNNSYARLPDHFFAPLNPTPVPDPHLVRLNTSLAVELGLDPEGLAQSDGVAMLAGNHVPEGAEPLAQAYAGHQFGHFVPQLGDGRACLLGEVVTPGGQRRDIQLKGSGPTPFSRRGDGRAALGPVLREYLVSEAMAALGIPTTRALAVVTTGEALWRERRLPGAVLTRVAASHIRVGTFQFFAARGDDVAVRRLADYAIARHYPQAEGSYQAFLEAVVTAQAELIAQWLLVGFIHGVMNTDNCSIAGETIDYGPCAFMEAYDPRTVFSSIDHAGRYGYGNQPGIGLWNLTRLAETLLPLLDGEDAARAALDRYAEVFRAAYSGGMLRKLGLTEPREGDDALAEDLLRLMAENNADFTQTFRLLADEVPGAADGRESAAVWHEEKSGFTPWLDRWRARLADDAASPKMVRARMRRINPAVIPRNHLVEAALKAAETDQDYAPFEALLNVVSHPWDDPEDLRYTLPAREEERVLQTFCGT